MTTSAGDRWADWLMRGRSAGMDAVARERMQRELTGTRDRVLEGADLQPGDVVLDAGCGTGLLTFGALDRIGGAGRVIGVDVSADALEELGRLAAELGVSNRLDLQVGSVIDLPVVSASVDAVVDRSVLIYVDDKRTAAGEYFRVLRHGGRVSIFEPINAEARHEYGFDLGPMGVLHERVEARKQSASARRWSTSVPTISDAPSSKRASHRSGSSWADRMGHYLWRGVAEEPGPAAEPAVAAHH